MIKFILIGDGAVGKTSLRKEYTGEGFKQNYAMTMGADFSIQRRNGFIMQIYDLAGQDNFREVRRSYYRGSQGAVLVFDVSKRETFKSLDGWMQELLNHVKEDIPLIVVGNKIDLRNEAKNPITEDEAQKWVENLKKSYQATVEYIETSVTERIKVFEVFNSLAHTISGIDGDITKNGEFPTDPSPRPESQDKSELKQAETEVEVTDTKEAVGVIDSQHDSHEAIPKNGTAPQSTVYTEEHPILDTKESDLISNPTVDELPKPQDEDQLKALISRRTWRFKK